MGSVIIMGDEVAEVADTHRARAWKMAKWSEKVWDTIYIINYMEMENKNNAYDENMTAKQQARVDEETKCM